MTRVRIGSRARYQPHAGTYRSEGADYPYVWKLTRRHRALSRTLYNCRTSDRRILDGVDFLVFCIMSSPLQYFDHVVYYKSVSCQGVLHTFVKYWERVSTKTSQKCFIIEDMLDIERHAQRAAPDYCRRYPWRYLFLMCL